MRATQHFCAQPLRTHLRIAAFARGFAIIAISAITSACALYAAEKVEFKPLPAALLRVDDHPPANWNLFTADKRNYRLIIQIGSRYLLVLVNPRQVYELDPAKLEHKEDTLAWHENDRPSDPLPESGWITRDVGEAYRIHFRLDTEGRIYDIDIPHPVVIFGP